ncbi:hypothetical protein BB558_006786 [Smittium angustum]|uniref:DNA polymerase eta n=1 Tax=Smittium angustum TaxID=133377 RepID=A0A2U1IX14_SMIAN|nr:hypothetical protein BB558_006786 [Smittium angustum]
MDSSKINDIQIDKTKVIIHLDLDCFYCQVEQRRLGLSTSVPIGVQQWNSLIAVNYEARKYGIKRGDLVKDAIRKCPDFIPVHVATYAPGKRAGYYSDPKQATHKVSLDMYRRASKEVFSVVGKLIPDYHKSSVDEAYLDVSKLVDEEIKSEKEKGNIEYAYSDIHNDNVPVIRWNKGGIATALRISGTPSEIDYGMDCLRLYYGALISSKIRAAVAQEVGFTVSTGIAHSRILAKLCSSIYKPNKQTIMISSGIDEFMGDMKINKLQQLGGKFGESVKNIFGISTVKDLRSYSLQKLKGFFPDKQALMLYKISRGIDAEIAIKGNKAQSIFSVKSFGPGTYLTNFKEVEDWISILCTEIWERLVDQQNTELKWPKSIFLTFYSTVSQTQIKNKSVGFPNHLTNKIMESPDPIIKTAKSILIKYIYNGKGSESKDNAGINLQQLYNSQPTVSTTKSIFPVKCIMLQVGSFYKYERINSVVNITNWISEKNDLQQKGVILNEDGNTNKVRPELEYDMKEKDNNALKHIGKSKECIKNKINSSVNTKNTVNLHNFFNFKNNTNSDISQNETESNVDTVDNHINGFICESSTKDHNDIVDNKDKSTNVIGNSCEIRDNITDVINGKELSNSHVEETNYYKCTMCPEDAPLIPKSDWDFHTDHHLAMLLQKRENHAAKVSEQINRTFNKEKG